MMENCCFQCKERRSLSENLIHILATWLGQLSESQSLTGKSLTIIIMYYPYNLSNELIDDGAYRSTNFCISS